MTSEGRAVRRPRGAALPDLVYPLKPTSDGCEELRYSLRSVQAHAEGLYRKVWIVVTDAATLPEWLTGVGVIEAGDAASKVSDVRAKIAAAAHDRRVAARMVLMYDDAFLVEPITEWPAHHMGQTSAYLGRLARLTPPITPATSGWARAVAQTAEWMAEQGYGDVLCRQGHRPVLWDRKRLADAIDAYPAGRPLDVVGLYDAAGAGGVGTRGTNAKITADDDFLHRLARLDVPWMSSNDRSFREGMVGGYIRGMLRTPSRYERQVA